MIDNIRGIKISKELHGWLDDVTKQINYITTREHLTYIAFTIAVAQGLQPSDKFPTKPLSNKELYAITNPGIISIVEKKFPNSNEDEKEIKHIIQSLTEQGVIFLKNSLEGEDDIENKFAEILLDNNTYQTK